MLPSATGSRPSTGTATWKRNAGDADLLEVPAARYEEIPVPAYSQSAFERATEAWIAHAKPR